MPQSKKNLSKIAAIIGITDPLRIVDIGANPIGEDPPYTSLMSANLGRLTGFEPHKSAFKKLTENKRPNEEYFPYTVGDGGEHTLNVYNSSGLTSLYRLRKNTLQAFRGLKRSGRLVAEEIVKTRTLDSMLELQAPDFLKIDIQGGELSTFEYAKIY